MRNAHIILGLVMVTQVFAQDKPEPPKREVAMPEDTVSPAAAEKLPQIDLPEYDITGTERIDLPEFSKTPIEEQRLHDQSLRGSRMEKREPGRAELGGSIKNPAGFGGTMEGFSGKIIAGYSSYVTPFLDGWLGRSFRRSDFLAKAGYRSTDGHVANADSRNGYASFSGGTYLPEDFGFLSGSSARAALAYQGDQYRLYGSSMPTQLRTIDRWLVDLSLNSKLDDVFAFTSALRVRSTVLFDVNRNAESSLGLEFSATRAFDMFELKGDLAAWRSIYGASSARFDPYFTHLGLSVRYDIIDRVSLVGGLAAYVVRGSDTRSIGRVYPRLGVSWYAKGWLTLFAKFEPYIQRNTLSEYLDQSPYLANDVRIRPIEHPINFSLGTEMDLASSVKTKFTFNYRQSRNYPLYVDTAMARVWTVEYMGRTRVLSFEGEMYSDLTPADHLGASLLLRSSRNSETGTTVPYLPSALLSGLYQHRFPFGLTLGTSLKLVGRQYADLNRSRPLRSFLLMGFTAEYVIIPRLTGVFTLNNILNQNQVWWENYPAQPRVVSLALGYTW